MRWARAASAASLAAERSTGGTDGARRLRGGGGREARTRAPSAGRGAPEQVMCSPPSFYPSNPFDAAHVPATVSFQSHAVKGWLPSSVDARRWTRACRRTCRAPSPSRSCSRRRFGRLTPENKASLHRFLRRGSFGRARALRDASGTAPSLQSALGSRRVPRRTVTRLTPCWVTRCSSRTPLFAQRSSGWSGEPARLFCATRSRAPQVPLVLLRARLRCAPRYERPCLVSQ